MRRMISLTELYWQEHGFEGLEFDAFLEDVVSGRFGAYSKEQVRQFLFEMENSILENIEAKSAEAPQFAMMKEEIFEQTVRQFRALRERFAP